jgi:hypothetical protein
MSPSGSWYRIVSDNVFSVDAATFSVDAATA